MTAVIEDTDALGDPPAPTVLQTDIRSYLDDREALAAECFGPAALVVAYDDEQDLIRVARDLEGQLTAGIFGEPDDRIVPALVTALARRAGRLLWNQWPTGVSVTYAQQHGGPYPATTAPGSTSVGTAAITRFLRPVAYQGFPQNLLPEELRDDATVVTHRRVDGVLAS